MKTNRVYISLLFKLLIVFGAIFGIVSTGTSTVGFMSNEIFLYFTIQSNIWIGAIALVFSIFDIMQIFGKVIVIPKFLYVIKYIFTVAISVTFVIFSILLIPQMIKQGNALYLISASNVFAHNLVPILAIIDYLIFDKLFDNKKSSFLYGAIMPLYYLVFSLTCSFCGVRFSDGQSVPYFFLNYERFGWFNISRSGLGIVYWIIIVVIIVLLISLILMKIKQKIISKKLINNSINKCN